MRVQRKVGADYERQQNRPGRRMAIVAAVAAIHVAVVLIFMSWRGAGHPPMAMMIHVKIIPASQAASPRH
jgi:hypothetical protein